MRYKPDGAKPSFAKRCCSQGRRAGFVGGEAAMYPAFVGRVKPVDGSEGE